MSGITSLGFVRKTLQEIKAEIELRMQEIFGDDVDLTPSEPLGQLIAVLAEREDYIWQNLELAYQSHKVDAVTGLIQDQLYRINNLIRSAATPTTATATLVGSQGTVIPSGSVAINSSTQDEYGLDADVTITSLNASFLSISVSTVSNATLYRVIIAGTDYDYTSDADATLSEILTGIRDVIDLASGISAIINNETQSVEVTIDTPSSTSVSANLTIDIVGTNGDFTALVDGPQILPSLALDSIGTPVSGWDDVRNLSSGVQGKVVESDEDFAIRRAQSVGISAENTIDALVSNLRQIQDLTAVLIVENDTSTYDAVNDLDPQHLWVIVQGGADQEIVDTIATIKPAGIGLKGTETGTYVVPSTGQEKEIRFERPTPVNPYIWVEITTDPLEYPATGSDDIKAEIKSYFDEILNIGDDLLYSRVYTPVNRVFGHYVTKMIVSESVITGSEPGDPTNIVADPDEVIVIDTSRITVVES